GADSEAVADVGAVVAQVTQVRSRGNAVDGGFRLSAEAGALSAVPTAAPKNQLDVDLVDDRAAAIANGGCGCIIEDDRRDKAILKRFEPQHPAATQGTPRSQEAASDFAHTYRQGHSSDSPLFGWARRSSRPPPKTTS